MFESHRKRKLLIPLTLLLSALLLNWLGMGNGPLTLGRALGLGAYILLTLSLCGWTLFQLEKVLHNPSKDDFFSALFSLFMVYLLLVFPFTPTAGRLNHRFLGPAREAVIQGWWEDTLCQTNVSSWYVGTAAWDRTLYVTERETFSFRIYNGFFKSCDAVYSPHIPPKGADEINPLGGGWYWVFYNTF